MTKYVIMHSKAREKISALILNSKLKKDIAKLSPIYQTSSLEAFHSVIIQIYCIFILGNAVQVIKHTFKHMHTPFLIYTNTSLHSLHSCIWTTCNLHRLKLAALHFNENSNREQAVTKKGEERYDIVFPKYKKGGHIVQKVLTDPTYGNRIQKKQHTNHLLHSLLQVTSVNL